MDATIGILLSVASGAASSLQTMIYRSTMRQAPPAEDGEEESGLSAGREQEEGANLVPVEEEEEEERPEMPEQRDGDSVGLVDVSASVSAEVSISTASQEESHHSTSSLAESISQAVSAMDAMLAEAAPEPPRGKRGVFAGLCCGFLTNSLILIAQGFATAVVVNAVSTAAESLSSTTLSRCWLKERPAWAQVAPAMTMIVAGAMLCAVGSPAGTDLAASLRLADAILIERFFIPVTILAVAAIAGALAHYHLHKAPHAVQVGVGMAMVLSMSTIGYLISSAVGLTFTQSGTGARNPVTALLVLFPMLAASFMLLQLSVMLVAGSVNAAALNAARLVMGVLASTATSALLGQFDTASAAETAWTACGLATLLAGGVYMVAYNSCCSRGCGAAKEGPHSG